MRRFAAYFLLVALLLQINTGFFAGNNSVLKNTTVQLSINEGSQEDPCVTALTEYVNIVCQDEYVLKSPILKRSSENYLLSKGVISVELPPPDRYFF